MGSGGRLKGSSEAAEASQPSGAGQRGAGQGARGGACRCITRQRGLPEVGGLGLLLGAVHLPVPAIGDGPGLVAIHGEQGLVPGLAGPADGGHHGHIQVARHGLVGAGGVALVEGELLGPGREVLAGDRRVHVLVGEGGGGLGAGLDGVVVGHAAGVVAAAKVAVGQRGPGRALHGGRAGAALLDSWLGHAGGGRLARRVGSGAGGRQGCGMSHQIPALVGRRGRREVAACVKPFHVLIDLIQAVVVEEHDGLDPAGMEEHGGCHSPLRIETSGSFLKAPKTEKRDTKSPRLDQG